MEEILAASRMESDELLNTLGAAEFAKFAASRRRRRAQVRAGRERRRGPVRDHPRPRGPLQQHALQLGGRCRAPIPTASRCSSICSRPTSSANLVVAKTFAPDLPSNSSGGSINILTNEYPEDVRAQAQRGQRLQRATPGTSSSSSTAARRWATRPTAGTRSRATSAARSAGAARLCGPRAPLQGDLRQRDRLRDGGGHRARARAEALPRRAAACPPAGSTREPRRLALGELSSATASFDLDRERARRSSSPATCGFGVRPRREPATTRSTLRYFYTKAKDKVVQLYENGFLARASTTASSRRCRPTASEIRPRQFDGFATLGTLARARAAAARRATRAAVRSGSRASPRASRSTRARSQSSTR